MMNVITHTETRHGNTWIVYTDADTGEMVAQLIVPVISTTN